MADEPSSAGLPGTDLRRPALRPGLSVVRRDDRHLQLGIDPPHRIVVEDDPDVRRVLGRLRQGADPAPTTPAGHRLVARLLDAGLLVDAAVAEDLTGIRAAARVAVEAPDDLGQTAGRLLRAAGVGLAGAGDVPTAVLVLADSQVARHRLDPVVRAGRPHLLVAGGPLDLTLGPFVVPGVTACLRCVDAHRGEADPRRAMVVDQCAREAGAAAPRDPVLWAMAVAWAVRDLTSFVDGERPATWSTTVALTPDLGLERRSWTRHPHCGCSWGEALAAG